MKKYNGISIGTKFEDRQGRECEVVDIYTIINSKENVVRYECMAKKEVLGQEIIWQVPFASVKRYLLNGTKV